MTDPAKQAQIYQGIVEKELSSWVSPNILSKAASGKDVQDTMATYYRVPMPGDPVTISGMRRRPDLNGARGEIVTSSLDEHGRVTVRVYDSSMPGQGASRRMKIQPFRLVPERSSSTSALPTAAASLDGRSSARSMSQTGSVVSRSLSQAGSAISVGRSVLSNSRSGRPGKTPPASVVERPLSLLGSERGY